MFGRRWILVMAVAVTVAACGSDDGGVSVDSAGSATTASAPPTTSTAPPTTSTATTDAPTTDAPTTVPATTDAATTVPDTVGPPITAGPTTTTPGITVGFDPACTETVAGGSPIDTTWDADLATFGPLGVTPAITVNLPLGHGAEDGTVDATSASVERIPGGFLLGIVSGSYASFDGSILAAVNTDGSIRWVRCFDERLSGPFVGAVELSPTSALVSASTFGGIFDSTWWVVSLADGTVTADLADLAAGAGVPTDAVGRQLAQTSREVVLGTWDDHLVDDASDRLVHVDLATMDVTAIPYPPGSAGQSTGSVYLWNEDVDLVMTTAQLTSGGPSFPAAVLVDGAWSTDPADLDAARPVTVLLLDTLVAYDARGRVLWERPDIGSFGGEGFRTAITGDIVVVAGCAPSGDFTQPCADEGGVYGLDASTGETLWQLDGPRGVGPIGDGVAIVTEAITPESETPQPVDWLMIDTATGEAIDGQEWPEPYTFGTECCGGDETAHTDLLDGVVAAVHGTQAFLWFPAELTPRLPALISIP